MAIALNGTTGISGVDGSASAPALQGTDSNTGINFASDTVNINTGGSTRATVDSSGNFGIGTTSPSTVLDVEGTIRRSNGAKYTDLIVDSIGSYIDTSHFTQFRTNGASSLVNAMRINSNGKVGIGNVDPPYTLTVQYAGANGANAAVSRFLQLTNNQGEDHTCLMVRHAAATSSAQGVGLLFQNSGGTTVGSIKFGASTSYNTSSDYRLKENAVAISDGITRLKTLKPYKFNWISDDTNTPVDGFFAHEVSSAVPEAISGTKDAVDSDNKPVHQEIDQSKIVPLLTAALQEAIAKIEVLETKVAALESG